VVLPVHDRAPVVRRAIDSVLAQTLAAWELIAVDDGSTDGTAEILAAVRRPGVRVLQSPDNRGANWARNEGVRAARGEIVSFLDSDDAFLPGKLERVVALFDARPDLDALVDSFEVHVPTGAGVRVRSRRNPPVSDPAEFRRRVFGREIYKATPAISVRRAALLEVGLFDETLRRRQDMDLLLRLSRRHRCAAIDEVLWVKHWTAGAVSTREDTFLDAVMDICRRHPDYLAIADYRRGLDRDLFRHFVRLARAGEVRALVRDARRYRAFGRFRPLLLLALLGGAEVAQRRMRARRRRRQLRDEHDRLVGVRQG
jgi:glycosyltransferase involved in cell wall biosynthesis